MIMNRLSFFAMALLFASWCFAGEGESQRWYEVYLLGNKVGYARLSECPPGEGGCTWRCDIAERRSGGHYRGFVG